MRRATLKSKCVTFIFSSPSTGTHGQRSLLAGSSGDIFRCGRRRRPYIHADRWHGDCDVTARLSAVGVADWYAEKRGDQYGAFQVTAISIHARDAQPRSSLASRSYSAWVTFFCPCHRSQWHLSGRTGGSQLLAQHNAIWPINCLSRTAVDFVTAKPK